MNLNFNSDPKSTIEQQLRRLKPRDADVDIESAVAEAAVHAEGSRVETAVRLPAIAMSSLCGALVGAAAMFAVLRYGAVGPAHDSTNVRQHVTAQSIAKDSTDIPVRWSASERSVTNQLSQFLDHAPPSESYVVVDESGHESASALQRYEPVSRDDLLNQFLGPPHSRSF